MAEGGINDAPSLIEAEVGIALGADVAMQSGGMWVETLGARSRESVSQS